MTFAAFAISVFGCADTMITGGNSTPSARRRARVEYPELKKKVRELHQRYKPEVVLIEDKASGTQLIQELKRDGIWAKAVKPKGDKVMRMRAQTTMIEASGVLLPKHAPWLDEYLHELAAFPRGKYDDQVDSTSQALEYIQDFGNWSGAAWYYYMQNELRKQGIEPPGLY